MAGIVSNLWAWLKKILWDSEEKEKDIWAADVQIEQRALESGRSQDIKTLEALDKVLEQKVGKRLTELQKMPDSAHKQNEMNRIRKVLQKLEEKRSAEEKLKTILDEITEMKEEAKTANLPTVQQEITQLEQQKRQFEERILQLTAQISALESTVQS